jgi:hypothetical protein
MQDILPAGSGAHGNGAFHATTRLGDPPEPLATDENDDDRGVGLQLEILPQVAL